MTLTPHTPGVRVPFEERDWRNLSLGQGFSQLMRGKTGQRKVAGFTLLQTAGAWVMRLPAPLSSKCTGCIELWPEAHSIQLAPQLTSRCSLTRLVTVQEKVGLSSRGGWCQWFVLAAPAGIWP